MGVYDGIQLLRKRQAKLSIVPLAMDARILDYDNLPKPGYNGIRVEINDELSEEEQVKSLIHEALHCGNPYNFLPMRSLSKGEYGRIEREIDELTEQVYSCQPMLISWLRSKIKQNT